MPNSCRSIIKKCLHKGAINQKEYEKLMRKMDETAERTGHWIPKNYVEYFSGDCASSFARAYTFECSECGTECPKQSKVCWECGARMKGEEDA